MSGLLVGYASSSDEEEAAAVAPVAPTAPTGLGALLGGLPPAGSRKRTRQAPPAATAAGDGEEKVSLAEKRRRLMAMPAAIPDSDSEDEDNPVLQRQQRKGLGLKALMPRPTKGQRIGVISKTSQAPSKPTLMPHSVRQRNKAASSRPKAAASAAAAVEGGDSDDPEAPTSASPFFSLPEQQSAAAADAGPNPGASMPGPAAYPSVPAPSLAPTVDMTPRTTGGGGAPKKRFGYGKVPVPQTVQYSYGAAASGGFTNDEPEVNPLAIDDEALLMLAGGRGRNAEIRVVDVKQDLESTAEWRRKYANVKEEKSLSQIASQKTAGGQLLRRKGQMSVLAAQAKQNEHDLKNAWASNSERRRAAKQRYGF